MEPLLDVIHVEPLPDHTLRLVFENGERRRFDMKPFLTRNPFDRLVPIPLFLLARVDSGTVIWPGGLDIAPETLWSRSQPDQESSVAS